IKNTRTINDRNVLELIGFYLGLGQEGPPDARPYHPKGTFTGQFRSVDKITHFTNASGQFTTGPATPQTGWEEKRIRGVAKLISSHSSHTFKFGTEDGITRGANWG